MVYPVPGKFIITVENWGKRKKKKNCLFLGYLYIKKSCETIVNILLSSCLY